MKAAVIFQALEALRAVDMSPPGEPLGPYWVACHRAFNALRSEVELAGLVVGVEPMVTAVARELAEAP